VITYDKRIIYDNYSKHFTQTILGESRGFITASGNSDLRLSAKLTCAATDFTESFWLGYFSLYLPPLGLISEGGDLKYSIEYKITDEKGRTIYEKKRTSYARGRMRGYYVGRKSGMQELVKEVVKTVSENSARMMIADISENQYLFE
jgi:hypothetical protein